MGRIRVLFVPSFLGMPSHFIPLLKLYQRLDPSRYEAAFWLPRLTAEELTTWRERQFNPLLEYYYGGEFLSHFDVPALASSQKFSVLAELSAYSRFAPDVVVDDCSLTTALARQMRAVPRVTLLRTGSYQSETPRDPAHRHSLQVMVDAMRATPGKWLHLPDALEGYFDAEAHVVPGIASFEAPPAPGIGPLHFCGPLILDEREESLFDSEALSRFLDAQQGARLAYVTFGVVSAKDAHAQVAGCFRRLFERDFSVITNVSLERLLPDAVLHGLRNRYFVANVVPMHRVCSRADLVIHVSSSAVAHYPVVHGKPAITIGTRYYDREHIARRLAALGLSLHLPPPDETGFEALFDEAITRVLAGGYPFDSALAARLATFRREIEDTGARFDLGEVVEAARSRGELRRTAARR